MPKPIAPSPCPFCGRTPTVQKWHGGGPRKHSVNCEDSGCLVSPMVCGNTKPQAIRNWNWRGYR